MMMPMMPGGYPYGYGGVAAPPVVTVNEKGQVVDNKKTKSTMALVQKIIMMEQELAILKQQHDSKEKEKSEASEEKEVDAALGMMFHASAQTDT